MGWSPFACFYTSAPIAEVFVQIGLPRSETAFPKTEGLFTVGIECRKGSLPVTLDRTSPLRDRDYGFATKSARAFVSEG
jgi:hypothetical protein